jgi:uncharacterized RmlC-like cupin family protein
MPRVTKITPAERVLADPTPGIAREQALANDTQWAGLARTAPGVISGWHHHGENDTTVYVEAGCFRVEFGAGGSEVVDAEAGDFVVIPGGLVHRESNPSAAESRLIVFRVGTGPPTINVDGPSGD